MKKIFFTLFLLVISFMPLAGFAAEFCYDTLASGPKCGFTSFNECTQGCNSDSDCRPGSCSLVDNNPGIPPGSGGTPGTGGTPGAGGTPTNGAAQYKPLVTIPGVTTVDQEVTLEQYLPAVYRIAIGGSFVLAVIMIILGGVQYMSTDAITGKKDGKERIQQALIGLLLVISAALILQTINPALLGFNLDLTLPPSQPLPGLGMSNTYSTTTDGISIPPDTIHGQFCIEVFDRELNKKTELCSVAFGNVSNSRKLELCRNLLQGVQNETYGVKTRRYFAGADSCKLDANGNYCLQVFDNSVGKLLSPDCSAEKDEDECKEKIEWYNNGDGQQEINRYYAKGGACYFKPYTPTP